MDMEHSIGLEDREKLLHICRSLLSIRFKYAHLASLFYGEPVDRKDIAVCAEQLQAAIDEVITVMVQYMYTGEGAERVNEMLFDVHARAQGLFDRMRLAGKKDDPPAGIHPDDWKWVERIKR
jgi:hypothetical protein